MQEHYVTPHSSYLSSHTKQLSYSPLPDYQIQNQSEVLAKLESGIPKFWERGNYRQGSEKTIVSGQEDEFDHNISALSNVEIKRHEQI